MPSAFPRALIKLTCFHFRKVFKYFSGEAAAIQQQLPVCMLKMPSVMHGITSSSERTVGLASVVPNGASSPNQTVIPAGCQQPSRWDAAVSDLEALWTRDSAFASFSFSSLLLVTMISMFFSCCSQRVTRREWWTVCWRPCSREQLSETAGNERHECKVRGFL